MDMFSWPRGQSEYSSVVVLYMCKPAFSIAVEIAEKSTETASSEVSTGIFLNF